MEEERMLRVPARWRAAAAALFIFAFGVFEPASAERASSPIGVVIMHGKGGMPGGLVAGLASSLEAKGYLVSNIEMPWSKKRQYDVDVRAAEKQVQSAVDELRAKGATHVFVAGHSQGGVFALHVGGQTTATGIVAIAPGGNVANSLFREKLGATVAEARKLVADGKGNERTQLYDFEGSKGMIPVATTAAVYLTWFDPNGAMNQWSASKNMNPKVPVLFIAPTGDYPGLLKVKQDMFGSLPANPLTRIYEPDSNHKDAPTASVDEIARWTAEVASRTTTAQRR
jgi:pimeloyl-ACP methyl ester carboxylesterase